MPGYKKLDISNKSLSRKRERISTVNNAIEWLIEEIESRSGRKITFPTTSPDYDWVEAIVLLYAKAVKTYRAIFQLCYEGFASEAIPLIRVLFEAELNLQYISLKGKEAAARFSSFIDFRRYEFYLKDPDKDAIKNLPKGKRNKFIENLRMKHQGHLEKYPDQKGNKNSWSAFSIFDMCKLLDEQIGSDYTKHYAVNYAYYSSFTHNDVMSVREYIDKSTSIRHVPDLRKIEVVFFDASLRIINIIELWAKNLNMASDQFLEEKLEDIQLLISKKIALR